jgi:hypothetical protein
MSKFDDKWRWLYFGRREVWPSEKMLEPAELDTLVVAVREFMQQTDDIAKAVLGIETIRSHGNFSRVIDAVCEPMLVARLRFLDDFFRRLQETGGLEVVMQVQHALKDGKAFREFAWLEHEMAQDHGGVSWEDLGNRERDEEAARIEAAEDERCRGVTSKGKPRIASR